MNRYLKTLSESIIPIIYDLRNLSFTLSECKAEVDSIEGLDEEIGDAVRKAQDGVISALDDLEKLSNEVKEAQNG